MRSSLNELRDQLGGAAGAVRFRRAIVSGSADSSRYASVVALTDQQIKRAEENQRWLEARRPDAHRDVAAWLRSLVPELDGRQASVAERMAADFDVLAVNAERAGRPVAD
jgi:hypothetical protein